METEYDQELLDVLKQKIELGIIEIHEQTESVIEEIEQKFVMGFNGIDWQNNEIILSKKLSADSRDFLLEASSFLQQISDIYSDLSEAKIILFGDSLTNLSYEMKFKDFIVLSDHFFSIPQHTYIWFLEFKKCINLTFENEIYFG